MPGGRRLLSLTTGGRPAAILIEHHLNFLLKRLKRREPAQGAVVPDELRDTTHPLSNREVAQPASAQLGGVTKSLV